MRATLCGQRARGLKAKKSATLASCAESTKGGGWRRQSIDASAKRLHGSNYPDNFGALQEHFTYLAIIPVNGMRSRTNIMI
jgi:hypothetical protein